MTCGAYMLQLAQAAAHPEQEAEALYALLTESLNHLCYREDESPLTIVNVFFTPVCRRKRLPAAVEPLCVLPKKNIAHTGASFDIIEGGICCRNCARGALMRVSVKQLQWMRDVLHNGLDAPATAEDKILFEVLRRYVESRLETTIKSSRFLP